MTSTCPGGLKWQLDAYKISIKASSQKGKEYDLQHSVVWRLLLVHLVGPVKDGSHCTCTCSYINFHAIVMFISKVAFGYHRMIHLFLYIFVTLLIIFISEKALSKNGKIFGSNVMVGVKQCIDKVGKSWLVSACYFGNPKVPVFISEVLTQFVPPSCVFDATRNSVCEAQRTSFA